MENADSVGSLEVGSWAKTDTKRNELVLGSCLFFFVLHGGGLLSTSGH